MPDANAITEQYAQITYLDAQTRLMQRFNAVNSKLPKMDEIKSRRLFDADDHWQNGDGFIGQLPGPDDTERTDLLRRAFSPEDIISEVLDTHIQNVLGDDPVYSLEGGMTQAEIVETLEVLKEWFEKRENTKVISDALRSARRETSGVLRAFIPSGMVDGEGRIQAKDLREALSKIWFRSEPIEYGGVIVDETTATELGLMLYRIKIEQMEISLCEYAYLNQEGETIWGTASAHSGGVGTEEAEPFMLNGALPIYQINAKALITGSVCQAQRDVNLSGTMLTRNNNLAGSRERLAVGVQPPGTWTDSVDATTGETVKTFVPAEMKTGPATFNFLQSQSLFDEEGLTKSLANPNIIFTDPVPVDTFLQTSDHWRRVIYAKAKMLHLLMAEDATASGKSRIEARKEFQSSLQESKQIVDAAGRWMVETALNIAAHFMEAKGKFLKTKVKFEAQVSTIELTPEEVKQIREDYQAGIIDLQTALELRGFKNVEEIMKRVQVQELPVVLRR